MKPSRIWVLIADGGRAKIVESLAPRTDFRDVEGLRSRTICPRVERSCPTVPAAASNWSEQRDTQRKIQPIHIGN